EGKGRAEVAWRRPHQRYSGPEETRAARRHQHCGHRGPRRVGAAGGRPRHGGRHQGRPEFFTRHAASARRREVEERGFDGVAREPVVLSGARRREWTIRNVVGPHMVMKKRLSHVDARGRVTMVDVGDKPVTSREAIARGSIRMSREALAQIRKGAVKKGDPLQAARTAGIMAAKQTSSLIPLCHPLPISSVHVELIPAVRGYTIEARVRTTAQTGVEMEALTAVAVAALTIYDMVKAVDKRMVIGDIKLMRKTGGKSGVFVR